MTSFRIGDMRHIMTYTIAAGKAFNMVLSHPENTDPSTWDENLAIDDMREQYRDWDPQFVVTLHLMTCRL